MGCRIVRLECQCFLIMFNGFGPPALGSQQQAQVVMSVSVIRLDPQCLFVVPDGVIKLSQPCRGNPQIIVHFGVVWLDLEHLFPVFHRLLHAAQSCQDTGQIVVCLKVIRFNLQHFFVLLDGILVPTGLSQCDSQVVMRQPIGPGNIQGVAKQCLAVFPITCLNCGQPAAKSQPRPRHQTDNCSEKPPSGHTGRDTPAEQHEEPDKGKVAITIGHRLPPDLYQPDNRYHHYQVPKPACSQPGFTPCPPNHCPRNPQQTCLQFAGDTDGLRAWAKSTKLRELSPTGQDIFLHGLPGIVFDASNKDGKFVLVSEDGGSCSVLAEAANGSAVVSDLEKELNEAQITFKITADRDDAMEKALRHREYTASRGDRGWLLLVSTVKDQAGGEAMLTANRY